MLKDDAMLPRNLTNDEIKKIIQLVGEPVMKFMVRRIRKVLIENPEYSKISVNSFLNAVIIAQATHDANILRWLQAFHNTSTGEELDFEKLRMAFTRNLYAQLDISLQ